MTQYIALVEKENGSAFGVRFPEVPGCFSAADTQEDVLSEAIDALSLHLSDVDLPEALGIEAVSQMPDVREALAAGAYLMAVPLFLSDKRPVRFSLSGEAGEKRALQEAADARGMTLSAFMIEEGMKAARGG